MSAAAVKTGVTMAGKKLGDFFVRQGIKVGGKAGGYAVKEAGRVAADIGKKAAVEAALGMAVEQGLPRAMGTEPTSSFAESAVRQASSGLISQGLQVGAARRFPESAASNIGTRILPTAGFIAGQVGGKRITDAAFGAQREFAPVQDTPTGATIASQEPEPVEIIKPTTRDLSGIQAQEALSEREKYEYQMKIAQIKNQPTHTYMHYQTEPTPLDIGAYGQARMKSAYSGDFS
jgi:hypothetical protein